MAKPPVAEDEDSQLRIQLLGEFAVWLGSEKIAEDRWRLRRTRSLVKLLALAAGHRMHRDQVADTLWPDSDPAASTNNFHQTLHAARRVLEPHGLNCLRLEDGFLSLTGAKGQPAWVDVEQFEAAAAAAKGSPDPLAYQAALEFYPGDLLPGDLYEEWILPRREALRQRYRGLLLDLARVQEARQESTAAIETLERLLVDERANEEAHIALMRLYALSGKRGQALRQYQALREVLRTDLETEPGEAATRLYEDIQANSFPPAGDSHLDVSTPQPPPHNLPIQLTSFIGREDQITEVARLVTGHRLVTLSGAGGTGKTRLALQVAEQVLGHFAQGAWLVELAPISDPELVPRAVMETFGLVDQPGQDLRQTLAEFLQARSLLLVLDNCEHVIGAAAALVAHLLRACRSLHILATSREILGVEGETPFHCPSLSLPQVTPLPEGAPAGLDSLNHSEAAARSETVACSEAGRLFIERAQAARPDFILTETNAAQVANICRRLDGIPLAIELAAARARMLSVEQIAARLDQAFRLLTGGSRSALPRHQTLKALIDWSYNLLTEEERLLLLRLSVFAGGWTLEAAEQVCADPVQVPEEQIIELMGQLIDKSLIQFEPASGREPHYRMLETIRQYAHERLVEGGEGEMTREHHLDYYLALAQRAEPHLRAFQAIPWLNRLEQELDNLRLALDWALSGTIEKGLQLTSSLHWFWHTRGHGKEAVERIEHLLEAQQQQNFVTLEAAGRAARGRALNALSHLFFDFFYLFPQNQAQRNQTAAQESLAIFTDLRERYPRDYAISRYCHIIAVGGTVDDFVEARRLFQAAGDPFWISECDFDLSYLCPQNDPNASFYQEEFLALKKQIGDMDGVGAALDTLSLIQLCQGNLERSIELQTEATASFEKIGNRKYAVFGRIRLSARYITLGNFQEARRQLSLALPVAQELNDPLSLALYYTLMGHVNLARGEFEQAIRCCREALELKRNFPAEEQLMEFYILGWVTLARGETAQARDYLRKSIPPESCFQVIEYKGIRGMSAIQAVGIFAAREEQMQRAAALFGSVDGMGAYQRYIQSPRERSEYEQTLAAVHAALGEDAFSAAWEIGRAMTIAQVLQYALETLDNHLIEPA